MSETDGINLATEEGEQQLESEAGQKDRAKTKETPELESKEENKLQDPLALPKSEDKGAGKAKDSADLLNRSTAEARHLSSTLTPL